MIANIGLNAIPIEKARGQSKTNRPIEGKL